jgi:hypothetical protein
MKIDRREYDLPTHTGCPFREGSGTCWIEEFVAGADF